MPRPPMPTKCSLRPDHGVAGDCPSPLWKGSTGQSPSPLNGGHHFVGDSGGGVRSGE